MLLVLLARATGAARRTGIYDYCMRERAALMRAAVATTVSPDCDSRWRLPLMRLRASPTVRRLEASICLAWLTR